MKTGAGKLKICYLGIGESVHMRRWLEAFVRRGHDISLITANPGEPVPGVDNLVIRPHLPGKGWKYFEGLISIKRWLSRMNPDILHAHFLTGYGWWGWLSGFKPLLLTVWGKDVYVNPFRSKADKYLAARVLARAHLVTGDSIDILNSVSRLGSSGENLHRILWGVETDKFTPGLERNEIRGKLGINLEDKVVVTNRNFTEKFYNNDRIVEAVPEVLSKEPNTTFLFLGDGPFRQGAETLAESLGVKDRTRFLGHVSPAGMPAYLGASDLFVSVSDVDATPVSLLEAMSSGLPVVARKLPSIEEWIGRGEGGYLISGDITLGLSESIPQLLADAARSEDFGRRNREYAVLNADRNIQMNLMEDLYLKTADDFKTGKVTGIRTEQLESNNSGSGGSA